MYTHTCVRCVCMYVFPGGTCARPTRLLLWGIFGRVVLAVVVLALVLLLQLMLLRTPSLTFFALLIARSTQRRVFVFVSVSCSVLFSSIYRRPRVAPQAAQVKASSSCVSHAIRLYRNIKKYVHDIYRVFGEWTLKNISELQWISCQSEFTRANDTCKTNMMEIRVCSPISLGAIYAG